jgi:hypothetical protein
MTIPIVVSYYFWWLGWKLWKANKERVQAAT